jgi:hypothetical protein
MDDILTNDILTNDILTNDILTNDILTGDLILTSSNTILHIMTAKSTGKLYSHSGIAIRYDDNNEISMSKNGKLYILHMNILMRKDNFNGECRYYRHTLLSKLLNKENIVAYRPLKCKYRTKELKKLTMDFYNKYKNITFHYESLLRKTLVFKTENNIIKHKFSCSIITIQYYLECINYKKFSNDNIKLNHMLRCNVHKSLISPGLLSSKFLPKTSIFNDDIILYNNMNITQKYFLMILSFLLIILFIGYFISKFNLPTDF